jgi:hypothetical protein
MRRIVCFDAKQIEPSELKPIEVRRAGCRRFLRNAAVPPQDGR